MLVLSRSIIGWARSFLAKRRIARFAIVGMCNTLFGLIAFPALYYAFGGKHANYMAVLALSYVVSILFSYTLNKLFVFKSRGRNLAEFVRFSSFYVFYFGVNALVLPFSVEVLHVNPVIAQTAMVIAISVSSYLWHVVVTFRPTAVAKPD